MRRFKCVRLQRNVDATIPNLPCLFILLKRRLYTDDNEEGLHTVAKPQHRRRCGNDNVTIDVRFEPDQHSLVCGLDAQQHDADAMLEAGSPLISL